MSAFRGLVTGVSCLLLVAPLGAAEGGPSPLYPGDAGYETTVQVRFLGVAGFLIRRGADVVLTAPLYSNPSMPRVIFEGPVYPNELLISRFHPDVEDVKAILVGHAHFDHLMDVPYVWERSPDAIIYGSSTTANILAGFQGRPSPDERFPAHVPHITAGKVRVLDGVADTRNCPGLRPDVPEAGFLCPELPTQRGEWESVPGTRIRLRALCAQHPPQYQNQHQGPGCIERPRETPPTVINDYREGPVFTYLIDFLNADGKPAFRIYFQDVPGNGRIGQVPEDLMQERDVDLALLCAGNWAQFPNTERIVENLRPWHVLLGHWENFFRPQDRKLEEAPYQNIGQFEGKLQPELDKLPEAKARTLVRPRPGQLFLFAIPPDPPRQADAAGRRTK